MIHGLMRDRTDVSEFDIVTLQQMIEDATNMLMHVGLLTAMDEQA